MSSNSPSGGMKLMVRSDSNRVRRTHWWNLMSCRQTHTQHHDGAGWWVNVVMLLPAGSCPRQRTPAQVDAPPARLPSWAPPFLRRPARRRWPQPPGPRTAPCRSGPASARACPSAGTSSEWSPGSRCGGRSRWPPPSSSASRRHPGTPATTTATGVPGATHTQGARGWA